MNSFGRIFRLTSFGESHGSAIGGVVDGVPSGLELSVEEIQRMVDRRRPGQSELTTGRREADQVEILSGVFEGVTTGAPIGFVVRNRDARSEDYEEQRRLLRPSHADYAYEMKYGVRDYRGGGRSSARETVARVVGGAIAMQALRRFGIEVVAYTSQIGTVALGEDFRLEEADGIDENAVRCPDATIAEAMADAIREARKEGDTIGGVVECVVRGCPPGLGEPVFGKLNARLAEAMISINAAKGFEIGGGFAMAAKRGSEVADRFVKRDDGSLGTATNHSGGIQGGVSNGEEIRMRVAFKPVATLMRDVETMDLSGNEGVLHARGRHDPCVVPRAVPIVESMAAMTIFDALLENRVSRLEW